MYVKDEPITFSIKVTKKHFVAGGTYTHVIVNPDGSYGTEGTTPTTGLTDDTDGNVGNIPYTPANAGLYKILFFRDDVGGDLDNGATLIGEYYFNVVEHTGTSNITV